MATSVRELVLDNYCVGERCIVTLVILLSRLSCNQ